MRWLVDVSAGTHVAETLQRLGHDVASVRDRDPRMSDVDILAWAVAENRLVVTQDKDFGELVFRSRQAHSGVLLLRMDDAGGAEKAAVIEAVVSQYGDQLPNRFAVYRDGQLRIR